MAIVLQKLLRRSRMSIPWAAAPLIFALGCQPEEPEAAEPLPTSASTGTMTEGLTGSGGGGATYDLLENPLLGEWRHSLGACSYVNAFDELGAYTITSTYGERLELDYDLMPPDSEGGRWHLEMTITSDNLKSDCSGEETDQTGNDRGAFLKFPDAITIHVFAAGTGGAVAYSWQRL